MGVVTEKIKEIQKKEKLTLGQVFKKYPHLAELQHEEMLAEQEAKRKIEENKKKSRLLLG
jgi:hypothetical protein